MALLRFFEISTELHFVSLFFLNERNLTTSLLMLHLKFTVVDYANLKSGSINKASIYGPLNMLFHFFCDFLFMFILRKLLLKTLGKKYAMKTSLNAINC